MIQDEQQEREQDKKKKKQELAERNASELSDYYDDYGRYYNLDLSKGKPVYGIPCGVGNSDYGFIVKGTGFEDLNNHEQFPSVHALVYNFLIRDTHITKESYPQYMKTCSFNHELAYGHVYRYMLILIDLLNPTGETVLRLNLIGDPDELTAAVDILNEFQHFGHTEEFKIYEVEDGGIINSEIIGSNGSGHGALAGLLNDKKIDVLICGGIGGGAQAALAERGIELCAGASGSADEAVKAYLSGELVNTGANCNHHGEGHSCGEHSCGDHDEHSCGGCGNSTISGKNVGKTCRTHYRGTFNDGTQFDSSYDRGEPLEFVCGAGMMIKGFDAAVANMEVGEVVDVHLMPSEAYGEADPRAVFKVEIEQMSGAENVSVGQQVYLQNRNGQPVPVKVIAKDEKTITFDANHEMAGKELNFRIELVEVR